MDARIGASRQNGVDRAGIERIAVRVAKAVMIQPRDDCFHAHRAFRAIALKEQTKYLTNCRRFVLLDSQMLFYAMRRPNMGVTPWLISIQVTG